jgi:hypothetical protein
MVMILDRPPSVQPSAVLQDLVNRLTFKFPALAAQIEKAAALVASGEIWQDDEDPFGTAFFARSQSRPELTYTVARRWCTCDAGQKSRWVCYHRIARRLLILFRKELAAAELAAPALAPATTPTPERPRRWRRDVRVIIRRPNPALQVLGAVLDAITRKHTAPPAALLGSRAEDSAQAHPDYDSSDGWQALAA